MESAITGNMSNLIVVVGLIPPKRLCCVLISRQMKAVKQFKSLLTRRRPYLIDNILGGDTRIVQPPLSMFTHGATPTHHRARSVDTDDRRPIEQVLVAEGVHRIIDTEGMNKAAPEKKDAAIAYQPIKMKSGSYDHPKRKTGKGPEARRSHTGPPSGHVGKGHAHNPLDEHLFLSVGLGSEDDPPDPPLVSESPPAADINIYETAYHEEIERLRLKPGNHATLYLTRRVETQKEFLEDPNLVASNDDGPIQQSGLAGLLQKVRDKREQTGEGNTNGDVGGDQGATDESQSSNG